MATGVQQAIGASPSHFYRNISIAVTLAGLAAITVAAIYFQGMNQPLSHWGFWVIHAGTTLTVLGVIGVYQTRVPTQEVPFLIPWKELILLRAKNQEGIDKREICLYSRNNKLSATEKMEKQNKIANSVIPFVNKVFTMPQSIGTNVQVEKGEGFAVASSQNTRDYMEDFGFVQKFQIGKTKASLYCCIDGHGDKRNMGLLVQAQLARLLVDILRGKELNDKNIGDAFVTAYEAITLHFLLHINKKLDGVTGGGAVIATLQINGFIYTANSGDSRAIRVCGKEIDMLSKDAGVYAENDRWDYNSYFIKGHSTNGRNEECEIAPGIKTYLGQLSIEHRWGARVDINATGLNMMRSLGDPCVRCRPKITKFKAIGYLVLGSDGLWEGVSNEEIQDGLSQMLENGMTLEATAAHFVQAALSATTDNVIAVLVRL